MLDGDHVLFLCNQADLWPVLLCLMSFRGNTHQGTGKFIGLIINTDLLWTVDDGLISGVC